MPEFKNKEEYEKWKAERLENPHATNKKPPQNYGSKIGWVLNGTNLSCLSMISVPVLNLFHFMSWQGH